MGNLRDQQNGGFNMIPFVNLKQEYQSLCQEVNPKIQAILENGYYVLGDEVLKFEDDFSKYIGSKHAVSVNSGSDALFLAIKSLGISKGDEVITVPHTFISTVDAIVRNQATPVFVDVEEDTYCMNTSQIESRITKKTKAILPVHLYGHPANMGKIIELAKEYDLLIIEDACQAHGAEYEGKKLGSIGDVGCFSFYPTKNLGAYGDGGIIVTNDDDLAENLKQLKNYGQSQKYHHDFLGFNSRLDELQASILRIKLKHLDEWNNRRRKIAELYNKYLHNLNLILPVEKDDVKHVYHLYVIRIKSRDFLKAQLLDLGIQTQIHYPIPINKQKTYSDYKNFELPVTEKICNEILSLPMNQFLKDDEIKFVCEMIEYALS